MKRTAIQIVFMISCSCILLLTVYRVARVSIYEEIRKQAMGVAIAVAAAVDAEDLEIIHTPEDTSRPEFQRVAAYLGRVARKNKDVRYIYTMRRQTTPGSKPSDYLYIVDDPAVDDDGDGVISVEEEQEPPGASYDASELPEMVAAWERPSADKEITPDPPYPDLMSGYAPIRNAAGDTVAILGVDILARTVSAKLFYLRMTITIVLLIIIILEILAVLLYRQRCQALERIQSLSEDLHANNENLEIANLQLRQNNARFRNELELAKSVQEGFLPKEFPFTNKMQFGQFCLFCEMLGGDLYDVFPLDDRRVAFYMADVAGHGVSAALISGLLKMGIETLRSRKNEQGMQSSPEIYNPVQMLYFLNRTLRDSLPDDEFITFCYGVFDTESQEMVFANAGHTPAIHFHAKQQKADFFELRGSFPIGPFPDDQYQEDRRKLGTGDKVILYTDGITEAHKEDYDFFGEKRLLDIISKHGHQSPQDLIRNVKKSVQDHLNGIQLQDDFSLLIIHIVTEE